MDGLFCLILEIISTILDWILFKLGFKPLLSERIKKWLGLTIIILFIIALAWLTIVYS